MRPGPPQLDEELEGPARVCSLARPINQVSGGQLAGRSAARSGRGKPTGICFRIEAATITTLPLTQLNLTIWCCVEPVDLVRVLSWG